MLFDPFEKQLHLPAAAVQIGDGQCRQGEVIGQERKGLVGGGIVVLDTPQFLWIVARRMGTGKPDGLIAFEPGAGVYRPRIQTAVLGVGLGPDEEKGTDQSEAIQPREIQIIADAKRCDIGNTAKMYAKAFFENMPFDAITLSPYMGEDAIKPFLEYKDKWVILLALTSNESCKDFQTIPLSKPLYKYVMELSKSWTNTDNIMYVIGANHAKMLKSIRKDFPNYFLLIPGVGHQGGNLHTILKNGLNNDGGILVNSSRSILFADSSKNFAQTAFNKASHLQQEMEKYF